MFKTILVPLDGSQLSQRALGPALTLSQQTGAELLLVRVPTVDTLSFAVSEAQQRQLAQDALIYLETIRQSSKHSQRNIRLQVLDGDVAAPSSIRRWTNPRTSPVFSPDVVEIPNELEGSPPFT